MLARQLLPICFLYAEFFFFLLIYQGDIQQLLILEDPQAAARYCVDYIPNCDSALPYSIQARREVSTASTRRLGFEEKNCFVNAIYYAHSSYFPFHGLIKGKCKHLDHRLFFFSKKLSSRFDCFKTWRKIFAHVCKHTSFLRNTFSVHLSLILFFFPLSFFSFERSIYPVTHVSAHMQPLMMVRRWFSDDVMKRFWLSSSWTLQNYSWGNEL